jgi:hypothetical protein
VSTGGLSEMVPFTVRPSALPEPYWVSADHG